MLDAINKNRQFWLLKSEPTKWSWDMQKEAKVTKWDGVRNYEARNNMKKMKIGDLAFFYHSVKEKRIVGIVEVIKEYYNDPNDPTFGIVDVSFYQQVANPVSLEEIKQDYMLSSILLITRTRLSVMPIPFEQAMIICEKSNTILHNN